MCIRFIIDERKNFSRRRRFRHVYNLRLNLQHMVNMEALIMPVVAARINTVTAGHGETARSRLAFELYSFGVVLCFKTYRIYFQISFEYISLSLFLSCSLFLFWLQIFIRIGIIYTVRSRRTKVKAPIGVGDEIALFVKSWFFAFSFTIAIGANVKNYSASFCSKQFFVKSYLWYTIFSLAESQ